MIQSKKKVLYIVLIIFLICLATLFILELKNNKTNDNIIENFESIRQKKVLFPWKNIKFTKEQETAFFSDNLHKQYNQYNDYNIKKDCIFISIASYRDKNCLQTLKTIYENARHPDKIYIGVFTQNKPDNDNEKCYDNSLSKYKKNIRIQNVDYKKALGPQYARYVCSHLWDGEEYFLMIDSHLIFRKDWDIILKEMYKKSPSQKTILTGYPPAHEDKTAFSDKGFTYTCSSHFDNDNFHIISEAQGIDIKNHDELWATPYASAGFFFTNYKWLYEVPFDPYLPNLFQGEEILLAIRSYTHGWDLFNLNRNIATHYYDRRKDNEPHFWDDNKDYSKIQQMSNMRYYYIIKQCSLNDVHPLFRKHLSYYGLGKKRTLSDYQKFANMDLKAGKINTRCDSKYNFNKAKWEKNT